ncbi:Crp/Fnr family transcriptional regulator [Nevskia ramosa]|uniref:Crp/Fnr family transcriptional regulator n=1 Tax=Nevskia ramosa TaxID=64002 RepID=UPI002356EADD|nr:Crp/Fnr family transcriptional regulator [Nevskia ramosa]
MPDILLHPHNHLLAALSAEVKQRLATDLKLVFLSQGTVLQGGGQPLTKVYFPAGAIVSLSCQTAGGEGAEISQVGNDGLVGIAAFMADDSGPTVAVVQSAGYAYSVSGQRLRDEAGQHPAMLSLMLRYTHSLMLQTAQMAVCNRHHSIDQQLCRWLLRFDDHRPGQTLSITHEQIANRLGVRRENITRATLKLHKLGVIRCGRSEITVLDRRHLERLSCECYGAIRKANERLLPPPAGRLRWTDQPLTAVTRLADRLEVRA